MKPFRPQVFLFRLLAGIFVWEGVLLAWSFHLCATPNHKAGQTVLLTERCPRLGQRAETIFELAIATTLSLLAGGTQLNLRPSSGDGPDALASQHLPLPSPPLPEGNRPQEQAESKPRGRGKAQG